MYLTTVGVRVQRYKALGIRAVSRDPLARGVTFRPAHVGAGPGVGTERCVYEARQTPAASTELPTTPQPGYGWWCANVPGRAEHRCEDREGRARETTEREREREVPYTHVRGHIAHHISNRMYGWLRPILNA